MVINNPKYFLYPELICGPFAKQQPWHEQQLWQIQLKGLNRDKYINNTSYQRKIRTHLLLMLAAVCWLPWTCKLWLVVCLAPWVLVIFITEQLLAGGILRLTALLIGAAGLTPTLPLVCKKLLALDTFKINLLLGDPICSGLLGKVCWLLVKCVVFPFIMGLFNNTCCCCADLTCLCKLVFNDLAAPLPAGTATDVVLFPSLTRRRASILLASAIFTWASLVLEWGDMDNLGRL